MGLPEAQRRNPRKTEYKDQFSSKPTRDLLVRQKLGSINQHFRHVPHELKRSSSALGREHHNKNSHYQISLQLGNYDNAFRNSYKYFYDKQQENKNYMSPKNTNISKSTKYECRPEIGKIHTSYDNKGNRRGFRDKTSIFYEFNPISSKKSNENFRGLDNRHDMTKALRDSSHLQKPKSTFLEKSYNLAYSKTQATTYYGSSQRSYKDSLRPEYKDDAMDQTSYLQDQPQQEAYESLKSKGKFVKPVAPHVTENPVVNSKIVPHKNNVALNIEQARADNGSEGRRSCYSSTSCSSEVYDKSSSETVSTNLSNDIRSLLCRCIRSITNVEMTEENYSQIKELKNLLEGNKVYQCYYTHGDQANTAFHQLTDDSKEKISKLAIPPKTNTIRKSVSLDNSLRSTFLKGYGRLSKQRRESFLGKISHIIHEIKLRRLESKRNKTGNDNYFNTMKTKIHNTLSQTKHGSGVSVNEVNSKTVHFKTCPRVPGLKYTTSLKTAAMAILKQDRPDFGKAKTASKSESIPSILRVKFKQQEAGADYTQNTTQTESMKNNQIDCVTVDYQFKSCSFPEKRTCETATEDIAIINEETQMSATEIVESHEKVSFATNTEVFRVSETDTGQVCTILRSDGGTVYKDSEGDESKINPSATSGANDWETESDTSSSRSLDEENETITAKKQKHQKSFICGWIKKIQSLYKD